jgi:23S rRNA-/tRNA-specific pseudouridylate synthase
MSIVKLNLLTGRKNQVRVQFAERGHPIVGDPKYGRPGAARGRMALHAKLLAFPHPYRGERMVFDTGSPDFFQRLAGGLSETDWASRP